MSRRTFHIIIASISVFILLMPVQAQDSKEFTKEMESLNEKLQNCGEDLDCLTRVAKEFEKLQADLKAEIPVAQTRIPVIVKIRNMSESKQMSEERGRKYVGIYWIFEYEAEENGFLEYNDNFQNFYL